jgi:hypothetical protein
MSVSNDIGALNGWRSQGPATSLFSSRNLLAFAAITIFSVPYQMRWGTIPDTSWLITACERMLSGERLYSQIYETNPPFSVWLYMPPVAVARALGVAPEILVQAWTYLAAVVGLLFSGAIVKRAGFIEKPALFALFPAFYAMLVIFPGNAFSEREHIGTALFMPLLALHAWRARKEAKAQPGFWIAAMAGLSGSALVLIKPYYAIMVLAPALLAAVHRRSLKPVFALENWVIGGLCVAYLATVILIYPEFLSDVYPQLIDVYAQVRIFVPILVIYGLTCFCLPVLAWWLWPAYRFPELAAVALVASIAGLFPLFYQAKGWSYHAYPAIFFAVTGILCLLALPRTERQSAGLLSRIGASPRALVLVGVVAAFLPFSTVDKPTPALVMAIRAATDRPTVSVISSYMSTGHPLTRMIGGKFVSTHVGDWLGALSSVLSKRAERSGDSAAAAHYKAIMVRYAVSKREEFERLKPDLIVFQKHDAPWTSQLVDHFGFDAILANYIVLIEDDDVRIYLRDDYIRPHAPADGPVTPASSPVAASG